MTDKPLTIEERIQAFDKVLERSADLLAMNDLLTSAFSIHRMITLKNDVERTLREYEAKFAKMRQTIDDQEKTIIELSAKVRHNEGRIEKAGRKFKELKQGVTS